MKDSCGLVRGSHSLQLTFVTWLSPGNKHTAFSWGFLLLSGFPSIPPQHCWNLTDALPSSSQHTLSTTEMNMGGPGCELHRTQSLLEKTKFLLLMAPGQGDELCVPGAVSQWGWCGEHGPGQPAAGTSSAVKAAMLHTDLAVAEVLTEKDYRSREDRAEPQSPAGSRKRSLGRSQGAEDAALRPHTAPEAAAKRPNSCRAKSEFSVKLFDSGIFAVIAATLDPNTFLPT